jgi:hypothetical protein
VNARRLAWFGLGLLGLLAGSLLLVGWLFDALDVTPEGQGLRTAPVAEGPPRPPAPRLQAAPVQDMQDIRQAENARLQSYGWVDRPAGIARIPIDRALDLVAEQGLPTWPAEPRQPAPGPTPEAGQAAPEDRQ